MYIVRENTEGEYSSIGGRMYPGTEREIVMQETVMSRVGVDRVLKFAFELAQSRPEEAPDQRDQVQRHRHHHALLGRARRRDGEGLSRASSWTSSTSTSSPRISCSGPTSSTWWWRATCSATSCSDLGPACTGTIGIAPSANLNPDRKFPSLFEPVHGSAPDIAGRNIANPIGQIWCGAMMLEFLGHKQAHDAVLAAIEKVLRSRKRRAAHARHRRHAQAPPTWGAPSRRRCERACASLRAKLAQCRTKIGPQPAWNLAKSD